MYLCTTKLSLVVGVRNMREMEICKCDVTLPLLRCASYCMEMCYDTISCLHRPFFFFSSLPYLSSTEHTHTKRQSVYVCKDIIEKQSIYNQSSVSKDNKLFPSASSCLISTTALLSFFPRNKTPECSI